jgi:tetratricopeptide (TPR) repeat protein
MVADIHRTVLTGQKGAQARSAIVNTMRSMVLCSHSVPIGEFPPPAPRDCFGRDDLIEKVVGLAENLEPIALIGAGGIGKTSIALTVLHHKQIEERFGENRRFIRCDQFPASSTHFLARLSKVIGAGIENPQDMTPLRPLLSSKEMLIVLDNAESILDPKGSSAEEIYSIVDELCQFKKVCLCITSRITTVPPRCRRPEIPTLSMEAACNIFYGIYGDGRRSSIISDLLGRLDYHALSITLLATTASHNAWDYDRLAEEWDTQRAQVLQTHHNKSLAATVELSLSSPTFHSLGPDTRDLLGVVAFFPQGVNEKNLEWLFPTISNRKNIFDGFCVLSLTYRSNGFVAMLAPIRDYLSPQDPRSSPLLCATRDRYFSRLSIDVDPGRPGFEAARWIVLEDSNVEHLLDIFTSIDQSTGGAWDACHYFIQHLVWYKPRQTVLRPRIEGLPDDHPYKLQCLVELSRLLQRIGSHGQRKRLLTLALELGRRRGDEKRVARTLTLLADVNRNLGLHKEGIRQGREALEIYERIGSKMEQAECMGNLTWLLFGDNQLDAAENTASRAIELASEDQKHLVTELHRVLGKVNYSKGRKEQAIHHFNTALEIATPPNWSSQLFWIRFGMAKLFLDECKYEDAHTQIERARSHIVDNVYQLGRAMKLQAMVWYSQGRLEDAKSGALHALESYEKSGSAREAEICRTFLQEVELAMKNQPTSSHGELPEIMLHFTSANSRLPC